MPKDCPRCGGWIYADDPTYAKTDFWCLMCGEWVAPQNFKPLPYVAVLEGKHEDSEWHIDQNGDIIDELDRKIEELVFNSNQPSFNVSAVAKSVHCSNYESRMVLDRLVRIGNLETFRYGPQLRWQAYRRILSVGY